MYAPNIYTHIRVRFRVAAFGLAKTKVIDYIITILKPDMP